MIKSLLFTFLVMILLFGCGEESSKDNKSAPTISTITQYKFTVCPNTPSEGNCLRIDSIVPNSSQSIPFLLDQSIFDAGSLCKNDAQGLYNCAWEGIDKDIMLLPNGKWCDTDQCPDDLESYL